ncbi:hypothetical protein JR316_0000409 [Psilocybe cubensis]|uniref:Het-C-domain-containing protein n=2 Tax=Psilocybe cubensis TaxID=181762 RepID=A0A8H8CR50_PSICU|nr:hypothetical protein JR316_0000409 [Psilocybe cubensis]KAH9486345.1 hypothetical protein JR316_0000409 [Psilocybe cubensis]
MANSFTNTFLLFTILIVLLPVETYAFGAGDIPDFAYLNEKAFRHGDIENILETLVKSAGGAAMASHGSGLLGKLASTVINHATGGSKFTKSDIKKVYFGNWLRDYSQAMDIAGLSKLSADTLVLVVSILGFMTFGFASQEFEVTADRLGVYLPVEHIDNPKGYAETEGDARKYHPKLRPPVDPRELEIDERTGMKKYMATEDQGWDTSTAFIRRTLKSCIEHGRRAGGNENADLWEAYRLLGTGLHTLEDLLAHSNWCELALRKMGHNQVFCHVGDQVTVNTPNGHAPPLVTGTFGSADFLHSLLGEAGDKLSQASVTDLSQKIDNAAQSGNESKIIALKNILSKFGGGNDDKLNQGEKIQQETKAFDFNPDSIASPEIQKKLLDLLRWRDDVMRDIIKKIEMVPGLSNLLEELSNAMNEYVYTVLAPYLGPILTQATAVLDEGSKAVIDNDDQYEVFNNPRAHDPSHSLLSKDHFGLILNEPAGKIAQIVVENTVNLIVQAWGNNDNPDHTLDRILEAFHHPYYASGRSEIQNKMYDHMERWINGLGRDSREILDCLTKESVRNHKNKRPGLDNTVEAGYGSCGHGTKPIHKPAVAVAGGAAAGYAASNTYGQQAHGRPSHADSSYGQNTSYNQTQQQQSSPYRRNDSSNAYGASIGGYGSQRRNDEDDPYGGSQRQDSHGGFGGQRRNDTAGYGGRRDDIYNQTAYGSQSRRDDDDGRLGGSQGYGRQNRRNEDEERGGNSQGYGHQVRRDDDDTRRGGGQGYQARRDDDDDRRGGGRGYGHQARRDDDNDRRGGSSGYDHLARRDDDNDRRGGGQGYGYQARRDDEDDRRGGGQVYSAQFDRPSYGQTAYGQDSRPHKSGRDRDSDSDDDKKHRKNQPQASYGGYGRHKNDSDDEQKSHGGHRQAAYGQTQQQEYGGYQQSGYAPSYGRQPQGHGQGSSGYAPSYGGRNDTFGAENLHIGGGRNRRGGDSDSDDDKRKRHGGRHGGY